jgi:hypothetical protein
MEKKFLYMRSWFSTEDVGGGILRERKKNDCCYHVAAHHRVVGLTVNLSGELQFLHSILDILHEPTVYRQKIRQESGEYGLEADTEEYR